MDEDSLHYTSPNHPYHLMTAINHLRQKQVLCDLLLKVGHHQIPVHKLMLSVCTPYFKNLADPKTESSDVLEVHLPGLDGESVQQLIEFFYTSAISVTEATVWNLLPAACTLQVEEVQNLCSDYLSSHIQLENCLRIHKLAARYLCSSLLKETTDYIKSNFEKILEEESFLDMTVENMLADLRRLRDTGLSEEQVLQGIKCWLIYCLDERQSYGLKIIKEFSSLKEKLQAFIPEEYLIETEEEENEVDSGPQYGYKNIKMISLLNNSVTTSKFIRPLFQSTPLQSKKEDLPENGNHGNLDEKDGGFMCFECAEMFDSQEELNKHAKTHMLMVNHNSPKSMLRNVSPYDKDSSLDNSLWSLSSSDQLGRSSNMDSLDKSGPSNMDNIDLTMIKSRSDNKVRTLSPDVNMESTDINSILGKKQFTITVTSSTSDGGDLNYICPVCGKSYMNRDSLSKHLVIHAGFVCNICGKSYTTKSNLQTHMRKHNGEDKPFNCTHCEKTFTSLSVLRVHLRTHTGEKPFECPTCGVSFAKNIHLRRHLSIHTGIKPHECNICNKRFSRSDHLKRHIQSIHTQDRPHICSLCGKDFVRKYELNKHMKQQHWGFTVGEKNSTDQSLNIPGSEEKSGSSKIKEEFVEEHVS